MRFKHCFILFLLMSLSVLGRAQKAFMEGIITYKVTIQSPDNNAPPVNGTFTCIIKDRQIRKEIKMDNGYQDVLLFNCGNNTVYSLQTKGDKKYAIQLRMEDFIDKQKKYEGFKLQDAISDTKQIAGNTTQAASVMYADGARADIYYTKSWYPLEPITFERFPGIKILPLEYNYKSKKGLMHFEALRLEPKPVENACFHIPTDYKMISYEEYQQLNNK